MHDGKLYRYSSFVPNSEHLLEVPAQTTRGKTLISVLRMERDEKTGKIKLTTLIQLDFMITLPQFIITQFMPKSAKEWKMNLFKYYNKNKAEL